MRTKSRGLAAVIFALLLVVGITSLVLAQGGDVENGKRLFGEYCAVCHGYDGQGRVGAALEGWFAGIRPEAFVRSTVSDGVADTMPAFSQSKGGPLTDQEIDDIAVYVLSWQDRVEPAPTPTPLPVTPIPTVAGLKGDPTAGAQIFARDCQVCHGERGQGGIGASLSAPIAAVQPEAFLRQVISDGVNGSPMPAFRGALSEDDIDNVVAYVLSWDHKPAPPTSPESTETDNFNWLVALLFLIVALVLVVWLITRFSQRKTAD
jgi:cytochrome c oxidase cbb3-type subunit 3